MKTKVGEVSEWLKEHAWKACVSVPGTEGSNPSLSAISKAVSSLPVHPAGFDPRGSHSPELGR